MMIILIFQTKSNILLFGYYQKLNLIISIITYSLSIGIPLGI